MPGVYDMIAQNRFVIVLIVILLAASPGVFSQAQSPNPKPPDAKPQDSAQAKNKANDVAADKSEQEPAMPDDPAAAAILETKPSTPGECIRAAKILSDLKQPDLAKRFLQKVIDAKLDSAVLAKLAEEFGTETFIQLSARRSSSPIAAIGRCDIGCPKRRASESPTYRPTDKTTARSFSRKTERGVRRFDGSPRRGRCCDDRGLGRSCPGRRTSFHSHRLGGDGSPGRGGVVGGYRSGRCGTGDSGHRDIGRDEGSGPAIVFVSAVFFAKWRSQGACRGRRRPEEVGRGVAHQGSGGAFADRECKKIFRSPADFARRDR